MTLVESLRKYVGEQVLPEFPSQEWELERKELLDTLKHLKEDRADLQATVELLQVRVQSLTHMLALQEEELTRKVGPSLIFQTLPCCRPSLSGGSGWYATKTPKLLTVDGRTGRTKVPTFLEHPSPFFPRTDSAFRSLGTRVS